MSTRREFIKDTVGAVAGIAFTSCGLLNTAHPKPVSRRRQVVVNGRRVKTVDVHAHCAIPEAMALMEQKVTPTSLIMAQDRIQAMDDQGIDVEALSINPFWYQTERDLAGKIIKIQNEKLAELCAAQPDRFVAFASVALQYPDLAVDQLDEAVKKYGMRGVAVGGSVNGEDFSEPRFHPFWAKAEQLGTVVFIHPMGTPDLGKRLRGNGLLDNVIGNPLDTTIALSHLIFEGTLDRFPGLKICAAHGGGYLASYADRSDHGCLTFPDRCDKNIVLKKKPTEYLKQIYFDSLIFTSEALRHLAAQVGSGQIVMGTDYPYPWTSTSVDHILKTPGFTDAQRVAMLGGTAAKLLDIKSNLG